jgi:phosphoribosylformimino-5-aminoimidazole carboxamide ribotide isomerase
VEIIPSIDLKSGRCVRLYQGDYEKETVYSDDPAAVALRWREAGAQRLHLVDLDGAALNSEMSRAGALPPNFEVIKKIVARGGMQVQVGGGIRTFDIAARLLDIGVDRVVIGTAAVEDPGMVKRLCREMGSDRVVVAVDARDGQVAIKGWTEGTSVRATALVEQMSGLGVRRFLYTDISRDGTLTQPNFQALEELSRCTSHPILASGGIASIEHIESLASIGVEGAILGRALYTGDVELRDAIKAAESATNR